MCLCQFDYISLKVMHGMLMQLFSAVKGRLQTAVDDAITLMLVCTQGIFYYHGTFIEFLLISSVLLIENHSSTVMPDCSCFESKYMVIYTGVGYVPAYLWPQTLNASNVVCMKQV